MHAAAVQPAVLVGRALDQQRRVVVARAALARRTEDAVAVHYPGNHICEVTSQFITKTNFKIIHKRGFVRLSKTTRKNDRLGQSHEVTQGSKPKKNPVFGTRCETARAARTNVVQYPKSDRHSISKPNFRVRRKC